MRRWMWVVLGVMGIVSGARGAEVKEAERLFTTGKYAECVDLCAGAIAQGQYGEDWWVLKARGELAMGEYAKAIDTFEKGTEQYPGSVALRLVGYEAMRLNGRGDDAQGALAGARELARRAPWRFADSAGRVAVGRVLALSGADARQVLELFFDRAKKDDPKSAGPWLATGELALTKQDFAVAGEAYQEAAKRDPDDPEAYYGLARAFENSDGERASTALAKALEINPRHVGSLLLQVDHLIDREQYDDAAKGIEQVLAINPREARAWAYRAVLAYLNGDQKAGESAREEGLKIWASNPEVDHLIGLKLSQKYRFAQGAEFQRAALHLDGGYEPAELQLCQDLLRLGEEEEGWRLAAEVFAADKYNVVAYNLETLHDTLAKFKELKEGPFVVRMDGGEADIYGPRVLRLLEKARQKLCAKYETEIPARVTVEIFPQQKDFAIRTFGLPGGAGYLGVCFGPVVTVNSPASRAGHPQSWEAVVWHEFCHTVTLSKSRNKMPRWLSEGISVYEEKQESPGWGQAMSPEYRELILSGGATPVSKLSGAFLRPKTPMHLMFAYYESSMVIEFIVERWGMGALKSVLADLGEDVAINVALAKRTEEIGKLDEDFAKWLKDKAEKLGSAGVDWERPDIALDAGSADMAAWNAAHPNSFFGLLGEGRALVAEGKFHEAVAPLQRAIALWPDCGEAGGPYLIMAEAYRGLKDDAGERGMLEKRVALDGNSVEARLRLAELAQKRSDWEQERKWAQEALGINPLIPAPHKYLAEAAEKLGDRKLAIEARQTLLTMDPLDRTEQHYRLARLMMAENQLNEARLEVVKALEDAPRYRAAHRLLLEIVGKMEPTTKEGGL